MATNDIRALKENAEATFDEVVLSAADLKLGTTSGLPVKTGTGGVLEVGAFGSSAGQFAEGNHTHSSLYDAAHAQNGATFDNFALTLVGELGTAVLETSAIEGATKTLTLPNASGTLELQGHTHTSANITDLKTAGNAAGLWDAANNVSGVSVGDYTLLVTNGANSSSVAFPAGESRAYLMPSASGTVALTTTAPASHAHGNITNSGAISGAASGLPVVTTTSGAITTLALGSAGQVLKVNSGGTAVEFGADAGGVSAVDSTTADVFSVSGSNLVADDGGLVDSSDPFVKWDDVAGKLVYANPLRRNGTGAFYVGIAPTTTSLGSNALNIQSQRNAATIVASGSGATAIGNARAGGAGAIAIGGSGTSDVFATAAGALAIGSGESTSYVEASGTDSIAIATRKLTGGGSETTASGQGSIVIGGSKSSGTWSTSIGHGARASLRGQFAFGGITGRASTSVNDAAFILQWSGSTTNNTQTELFLGAISSNRATIGASRIFCGEVFICGLLSDNSKALFAHRTVVIKRDGSNNTALVGSVQTIGTDQSTGSPTWSVDIDADDTNESLRIRVTGATSETVYWRATAFLQEMG